METAEARQAYADRAWQRAYDAFAAAEAEAPLSAEDYDRFAATAHVLGRMPDYYAIRERAYTSLLERGAQLDAAQAALWLGVNKLVEGDAAVGGAWIGRAARIITEDGTDSPQAGFLHMCGAFEAAAGGDLARAIEISAEAAEVVRRHGATDMVALATHQQGLFLLDAGRIPEGLALLDETMLLVAGGRVESAMVEGIVYCGAISGCWAVYELSRAQQWTAAMTTWCDAQPDLRNFTSECKVRRAELKQLHGAWNDALDELAGVSSADIDLWAAGAGASMRGNLDRLQGRFDSAEASFAEAARLGFDPQPGLALLRLAQGAVQAAAAMVRRCLAETADDPRRVEALAAAVEILLAVDDPEGAASAAAELDEIAQRRSIPLVRALAAQATATVALAQQRPETALPAARLALRGWLAIKAPYQEARTRLLISDACRDLGDNESASTELALARTLLESLDAVPDLARLSGGAGRLSARELEVLRLVATGATNRAIAEQLVLSERTVDRHVSNIFGKLGVTSRAAATAYAFERELL